MFEILLVIHFVIIVALIGIILIQRNDGDSLGGIGGGTGSTGSVFSARATGNIITRATSWLGFAFFASSVALAYVTYDKHSGSILDSAELPRVAPSDATGPTVAPKGIEPAQPLSDKELTPATEGSTVGEPSAEQPAAEEPKEEQQSAPAEESSAPAATEEKSRNAPSAEQDSSNQGSSRPDVPIAQ